MLRMDIMDIIGRKYLTSNLEKDGEFSYVSANIPLDSIQKNDKGEQNYKLDMRFQKDNLSILVETINKRPSKKDVKAHEDKLLNGYCVLEQRLNPNNNIILILAHCGDSSGVSVWKKKVGCPITKTTDTKIKSIAEYDRYFVDSYTNNEIRIKQAVLELNEILHKNGIPEGIRGQFVGTCLLALKSDTFIFANLATVQIIAGIKQVIEGLLNDNIDKATKLVLLNQKVLENQKVRNLKADNFAKILTFIRENIIPNINQHTHIGQDLLNLFFTTFNKYVGKADKNQAFTPDHITHFMCKVAGINKNTRVLDPTCGSGSFIVQALIQELNECDCDAERESVKKNNIYGIELEEKAFGLATTNMLIHGDGNSNIVLDDKDGCFGLRSWIQEKNIDVVLMNPPYNAKPNDIPEFVKDATGTNVYRVHDWDKKQKDGKEDPTKGFCFVNYIADCVGKTPDGKIRPGTKLLCLLPMSCAIETKDVILREKEKILKNNTLDAVFTLPPEMFYPGASVNACCMVFTLGVSHFTKTTDKDGKEINKPRSTTFFGYFRDDGFIKKKNLGRISREDETGQVWQRIEKKWLDLYKGNTVSQFLGIRKEVGIQDEWLAEAYIETDYGTLNRFNFEQNIRALLASIALQGKSIIKKDISYTSSELNVTNWHVFAVKDIFSDIVSTKGTTTDDLVAGNDIPYISAKKEVNGLEKMCSSENVDFISQGNCIVFIALGQGSAGYTTYQPYDFIGMYGKTIVGYAPNLNKYNGIFLETVLDMERPKFSFGRSWTGNRLYNTKIKLPAKQKLNENGEAILDENGQTMFEPDWDYMENYIKSLPYADLI